jgi:hypothetical protein
MAKNAKTTKRAKNTMAKTMIKKLPSNGRKTNPRLNVGRKVGD